MLEDGWHDFQHQNQHVGGEAASCAARKWSAATVLEPTCPRDLLQRYTKVPGPPYLLTGWVCLCCCGQGIFNRAIHVQGRRDLAPMKTESRMEFLCGHEPDGWM